MTKFYCGCVVLAMEALHAKNNIYRDLKPENILLDAEGYVKICDFGFAKHCADRRLRTVCGSPQYMAPEVNGRESYAGFPVDMWALGALLYEVRTRTMPHAAAIRSLTP